MIDGKFGEIGELYFEIGIVTVDGDVLLADALLDTGFTTGWLAMDIQDIESLGWLLLEPAKVMQTARAEELFDLYEGKVLVDGKEFIIPVIATIDVPEILMGLQWLKKRRLVVDFSAGVLTLKDSES
jgi:predicted aspartyl protease